MVQQVCPELHILLRLLFVIFEEQWQKTNIFFHAPLDELFPTFDSFSEKFVALSFTKKDKVSNVKTKYAINKLCFGFCL